MPISNIVEELVPALNQLMNIQQPVPSSLPPVNNSVESLTVASQLTVNYQTQTAAIPKTQTPIPTTNLSSRSSNKSFSNRLGMMTTPSQTQNSMAQESKPLSPSNQILPQKTRSPVIAKQPTNASTSKNQNESSSNNISSIPPTPKCKNFIMFFYFIFIFH